MRQEAFTREMITMLCSTGYLGRKQVKRENVQYGGVFDTYVLTDKGNEALCGRMEVRLPVPPAIRQQEEEERQKAAARAKEIEQAGFKASDVPKKELEAGDGPMLWYIRKLKHWRESGQPSLVKQADNHEELHRRILAWRDAAAQRLGMAPADVLSEEVAVQITY
jgi:hypothetical protein